MVGASGQVFQSVDSPINIGRRTFCSGRAFRNLFPSTFCKNFIFSADGLNDDYYEWIDPVI